MGWLKKVDFGCGRLFFCGFGQGVLFGIVVSKAGIILRGLYQWSTVTSWGYFFVGKKPYFPIMITSLIDLMELNGNTKWPSSSK